MAHLIEDASMTEQRTRSPKLPHSWGIADWPAEIFPNSPERARYFVRENRRSLLEANALARVGRQLVVLGEPFDKWLRRQGRRVPGYTIAPNRSTHDEADSCSV
jgi:hypothetical protein